MMKGSLMTKHLAPYFRYILAVLTAAALFITGAGLSPATAADDPPPAARDTAETVTTTVEDKTVLSETDASTVGLTLPGQLVKQPQISLTEVPEEYLETTQETPIASTKLPYSAISSYETDDGTQTLLRIDSHQAVKEYRFPLSLPVGATAQLVGDGSILIKDAQSEIIGGYHVPWAVDANDAPVPTRFKLEGHTLIQTVDFTEQTIFPVVADPNLWQRGISAAAAGAVGAAVAAIPGGGPFAGFAAGCTFGAMNAVFDGRDFWGAFWGCVGTGGFGSVTQAGRFTVAKIIARFR